jgi:soluble lytic murein transglycosylase
MRGRCGRVMKVSIAPVPERVFGPHCEEGTNGASSQRPEIRADPCNIGSELRLTSGSWVLMKRLLAILAILIVGVLSAYYANQYWIHRYDDLIARQAGAYHIDPDLVWSIIYEETYFRPWKNGRDGEVGLMQVTPGVGREWAVEKEQRDVERQITSDAAGALKDPQRNIDIGCWYLEKFEQEYRALPDKEVRMIAAYNAGPGRAADWSRTAEGARPLTADEFIARIDIPSTRAYVTSVFERYRKLKAVKADSARSSAN